MSESGAAATPAGTGARHDPRYARGVALVMLAGCFWSLGGILIRSIDAATDWQILYWRSASVAATLFLVLWFRHRRRVFAHYRLIGIGGLIGALSLATGFAGFIFALNNTTVANAVFLLSAAPFATALLAWVVLGERVLGITWIAMAVALVGVAVMVLDGFRSDSIFGNAMALLAMLGFSGFAVALRHGRNVDMLPMVSLAGVFAAAVAVAVSHSAFVSLHDLLLCATMGAVQIGVGMVCFTSGSRHVPAAELALLSLTEVILAPIWVWLGVGEVPTGLTLIGGAIVLAAIVGLALTGLRRPPVSLGAV